MNEKQLIHFKDLLLKLKQDIKANITAVENVVKNNAGKSADPLDQAGQEEKFSMDLAARKRNISLLKEIEESLDRINKNDYGYCFDCGDEIGIKRLEVYPTATQCIECKSISEKKEKQLGSSFNVHESKDDV